MPDAAKESLVPPASSNVSCHMTSNSDTLTQLIESEHHPSDEDDGNCKSSEKRQAFVRYPLPRVL
jgi:hypothetical protein